MNRDERWRQILEDHADCKGAIKILSALDKSLEYHKLGKSELYLKRKHVSIILEALRFYASDGISERIIYG